MKTVALALGLVCTGLAPLTFAAPALAQASAHHPAYQAAILDAARPEDERARDAFRAPAEMLAFAEVAEGQIIADIRPGAGYFTRLFAKVVGDKGKVYAFVPNLTSERENPRADALVSAYPNVARVNGDLDNMTYDQPLDLVFMSQEYHDFHIPRFGVDVAKMNADIFKALKPGGLYVVIDHQAASGTGKDAIETLHRIEGDFLRREVEAAGFIYEAESPAVANPADNHSLNVFDDAIRGRTDQFVYRFRKPG